MKDGHCSIYSGRRIRRTIIVKKSKGVQSAKFSPSLQTFICRLCDMRVEILEEDPDKNTMT